MADIFISYARADRDKVERLAAALTSEGYSVWWDRHIAGGSEFSEEIEKELRRKRVRNKWPTSLSHMPAPIGERAERLPRKKGAPFGPARHSS